MYICITILASFVIRPQKFGGAYSRRVVRPSVRPSVRQSVSQSVSLVQSSPVQSVSQSYVPNSCPAHNFVI